MGFRSYCIVVADVQSGEPKTTHWYANGARSASDDTVLDEIRRRHPTTTGDLCRLLEEIGMRQLEKPYSWESLALWIDDLFMVYVHDGKVEYAYQMTYIEDPWQSAAQEEEGSAE